MFNRTFYYQRRPIRGKDGKPLYIDGVIIDITERKRAEKALQGSEEKFKAITASAKDAIIIMDNDGNISYWNEASEKMFGYSSHEALGKEMHMLLAPKMYHDAYRKGVRTFKKTGLGNAVGETRELEAIRKDGTIFPIELSVSAVKIDEKWHATGTVRDITERKKAEEALFKAHDELEYRVEERTAELIRANEQLRREITERKRAEEELHEINRSLRTLSECNQVLVRASDESGLLHDICRIIVEAGGYRMALVGYAEQDEQKTVRPVAQMGYEENFLETVNLTWADTEQGHGPLGTAIRTRTPAIFQNIANESKIVSWREAALKREYASAIGLPLIADSDLLGALAIYSAETHAFNEAEVKLLTELADGLAYGFVTLRTRTKRKRAEEALKRAHAELEIRVRERTKELGDANIELQNLNKEINLRRKEAEDAKLQAEAATMAKSDFLANMSHELRTPLNAIIGFSDMMFQGMTGKLTGQQLEYLSDIRESGELLLSLINDILDLSKVQAGKMELELREFNVKDLIERCMILFKEKTMKHRIKFTAEVAPDLGLIEADERKIKQVIANLLSNAVKFTPDGGSVSVQVRLVNSEQYLVNNE